MRNLAAKRGQERMPAAKRGVATGRPTVRGLVALRHK